MSGCKEMRFEWYTYAPDIKYTEPVLKAIIGKRELKEYKRLLLKEGHTFGRVSQYYSKRIRQGKVCLK